MLDALISAGANLIGGMLNRQSQEDFNNKQIGLAHEQMDLQKEFATHGIQWKAQDAIAAGLHPLAALGAQTSSPSPVSVGGEAPKYDFSSMGQDLSRAAKAAQDLGTRQAVDQQKANKLDLESKQLDNEIKAQTLASRILSTSRAAGQLGPPVPLPRPGPSRTRGIDGRPEFAITEDEIKQQPGDAPKYKQLQIMGVPVQAWPGTSDVGGAIQQRYGEESSLTNHLAYPTALADLVYSYGLTPDQLMGMIYGGSGSRIKRFRRGNYTASSYRPWAE